MQISASFDSSRVLDVILRASYRQFQVRIPAVTFLRNVGFMFLQFFFKVVSFNATDCLRNLNEQRRKHKNEY